MRRVFATVAVMAGCVLGAAGCGQNIASSVQQSATSETSAQQSSASTAGQTDTQRVLAEAYTKTENVKTAKMSITVDTTTGGNTSHTTMSGVVQFDPMASDMTTQQAGVSVEVRTINKTVYIAKPNGKWQKIDLSNIAPSASPSAQTQSSPAQALQQLQSVSNDAVSTGTTTINGVQVTGYKATVDMQKLAAKANTPAAQSLTQFVKSMGIQVWLDGQGRLVRSENTMTMDIQGHTYVNKSTTDLTDYGTPVHVVEPPASEITS